jgi:DUF2075 family protein
VLIEVSEFCRRTGEDLDNLVEELQDVTGREGDGESFAWRSSLPVLAKSLSSEALARLHLYFDRRGQIELEYRLPASGCWCDAILLGQGSKGPGAVIIELKHWTTGDDRPGPSESLVWHGGDLVSHPAVQVGSYVDYCRRFHSAIHQYDASVDGCVLFTRSTHLAAYLQPPHAQLVDRFPAFGSGHVDISERLPTWIRGRLSEPNEQFASDFSSGVYQQDRRFVRHVASLLQDPAASPFVLLDKQREAYDLIIHAIEEQTKELATGARLVVIVEGPPGSGKSVLAAQLWARMALHPSLEGNVVMCTTSGCQRSNWEHLFHVVARNSAGSGLVVPANAFNPGLQPTWVKQQRSKGNPMPVADWRGNLAIFASSGRRSRMPDLHFATTVVDEAHALIDPTVPKAEGVPPSGWSMHAGPQVWHIIRASRITVLFTDSEQSYRDNETTTPAMIEQHAMSIPGTKVKKLSLNGAQFRCGGAKEYTDWVEVVLDTSNPSPVSTDWRRTSENVAGQFEFELLKSPWDLERALRTRSNSGASVRLVASYARKWKTKNLSDPHSLPEDHKDFCIESETPNGVLKWSKIWNYAPEQDYTFFVQARDGSPIQKDPLCEVGCPYVVRGFDFDYVGLLWLSDLVRRDGVWKAQIEHVHETAWKKTVAGARGKNNSEAKALLLRRIQRGYRILLTRAIKGVYVWCEDDETREYLVGALRWGQS